MDCSPPGSSVHEILQASILEWVVIPFSGGIFPTQGSNPSLVHCRGILYHLSDHILREKTEGFETEKGRWGGDGDRGWSDAAWSQGVLQTQDTRRGKEEALPAPPAECGPADALTLDSTLRNSESFHGFKSPSLSVCCGSRGKQRGCLGGGGAHGSVVSDSL